jgi:hypothetical protein
VRIRTGSADRTDGLVEILLTEFPLPARELPWGERLIALAGGIRATAHRHPGVFPLLLSRPTVTEAAAHVRDPVYQALREAGVRETDLGRTERLLSTAILGFAVSEATGRFGCLTPLRNIVGIFGSDSVREMLSRLPAAAAAIASHRKHRVERSRASK